MTQDPETLLQQTRDLLKQDSRSIAKLASDTGLGYHWLRKMRQGSIKNPGFKLVTQLHQKLTNA